MTGTREEIDLLFGKDDVSDAAHESATIRVIKRIVLNPFAAKRFAAVLQGIIGEYEAKFGPITLTVPPAIGWDRNIAAEKTHLFSEKAALLFPLVQSLNTTIGYERSFKIREKTLLDNRFLLGINKRAITEDAHERIVAVCERMNMPPNLLETFTQHLSKANYVHYGFEENEGTCLYKVYLEFWHGIREEIKSSHDASKPFLMHLGFKWNAFDNARATLTRYTWYPWIPVTGILSRVIEILDPQRQETPLRIIEEMVSLASGRIPDRDILYLEVTEEGNPRRSFDINIYRANLQVGELYPLLTKLCRYYSLSSRAFHTLYDQIKTKRFGHLAGGVDREGKDFFTLYYGAEGISDSEVKNIPVADLLPAVGMPDQLRSPQARVCHEDGNTHDRGKLLYRLVKNLNIQVGFERSFKLFRETILPDRFLMGFRKTSIRSDQYESIRDICRQIAMPDDFRESFEKGLSEANIILFGFERNERNELYKAYLEYGEKLAEVGKETSDKPEPCLIHRGYKWDASDNTQKTIARYTCFPLLTIDAMLKKITDVFYGHNNWAFEMIEEMLIIAAMRVDPLEFLYFEAREDSNPRISFDINMYRANLRMAELYPFLMEMARHFLIPAGQMLNLHDLVKTQIFGHLAGGMDREGRDFLSLYFGEKGSSTPLRTRKNK